MYGMGSSCGGYASQYDRQMAKEVTKQKSSVGDYYARKAEMLKILMTDSDSGESCTRGTHGILFITKANCLVFRAPINIRPLTIHRHLTGPP